MLKRKKSGKSTLIASLFAVIYLSNLASGNEQLSLTGVGLPDSTTFHGVDGISMVGGAELVFKGYGFASTPKNNQVMVSTSALSSATLNLEGTPLTEDDEFNSQATGGKLRYTMPAISDLFSSMPLSSFYSFSSIQAELSVLNTETGTLLKCAEPAKCRIVYKWTQTPKLNAIVPPIGYQGQEVCMYTCAKSAFKFTANDRVPKLDLRIDGTSVNQTGYNLGNTAKFTTCDCISGKVMTDIKNMNADIDLGFFGTGKQENHAGNMVIYSLDGTASPEYRVYPSMHSLNYHQGYLTGGQRLVINGTSLNGNNVTVTVDGYPCTVESATNTEIVCITGENTGTVTSPIAPYYVGQQGLQYYNFQITQAWNGNSWYQERFNEDIILRKHLWTTPEVIGHERGTWMVHGMTSYFKAPATGDYRFFSACDDSCELSISTANPPSRGSMSKRMHYGEDGSGWRNFVRDDLSSSNPQYMKRFTDWIPMVKDSYYYFETTLWCGFRTGYQTIGMEVKSDALPASHPQFQPQLQRFSISQSNIVFDTMEILVQQPDSGIFVLMYMRPDNNEWVQSGQITSGCSASEMAGKISSFYQTLYKVNPQVTLTYRDINGLDVAVDSPDVEYFVYKVEVPTALNAPSVETITAVQSTSLSSISFTYPADMQLSSPPLSGSYYLDCANTDGQVYQTQDIAVTANANQVKARLVADCSFLSNAISVLSITENFPDKAMGVEFEIKFGGVAGSLNQYQVHSSPADPIIGVDLAYTQSETRPYGESVFFPVIPPEYFFTAETKPQVIVQVDDYPVLCANLDCHYTYIDQSPLITGFTVDNLSVIITGTELPLAVLSIELGRVDCVVDEAIAPITATQIACTLESAVPAGTWYPKLQSEYGLIKVDSANLAPYVVAFEVTSISPMTSLNQAGGNILTISGSNFPAKLDGRYNLQIMLNSVTRCVPVSNSQVQILCKLEPIVTSRRRLQTSTPLDLTITMESDLEQITYTMSGFEVNPDPLKTVMISPQKLSPIATKTVEIQLDSNYPTAGMTVEDFEVTLVPVSLELTYLTVNNEGIRPLRVIAVNETTSSIYVKYGGAYSGTYDLVITSKLNGNVDATATQLVAVFEINAISPTSGSIYGGTVLTIDGGPFTLDLEETFIKVGTEWWDGVDHYCYLISASETQVKCRLPLDLNRSPKAYEVIGFSATYEESNCNLAQCTFTFIEAASLPTVSSYAVQFNTASSEYEIAITGSGFTDPASDIEFFLDRVQQTVLSATATEIVVQVDTLATGLASNSMDLYLAVGIPDGYTEFLAGATFAPMLLSMSTLKVSAAGSIIQATVKGVGINDQVTLVDAGSSTNLCLEAKVLAYGLIQCRTDPSVDFSAPVSVGVMEVASGAVHTCQNSDPSQCTLSNLESGSEQAAVVSAGLQSSSQLVLTGQLFPTAGSSCEVEYAGAVSSSCTIDSVTQVTATFSKGVPVSDSEVAPILRFIEAASAVTHVATSDSLAVISNPLVINSATSGLVSSFAGGRQFSIAAPGLAQSVQNGDTEVKICQKTCLLDLAASEPDQMTCLTPPIATKRSNQLFEIAPVSNLYGEKTIFWRVKEEDANRMFDQDPLPGITFSQAGCYIGIELAQDYVGVLQELSFFMAPFNPQTVLDANLTFQGSSDGFLNDVNDIIVIGEEIHEGWNYYDLNELEQLPSFSSYRMTGGIDYGCHHIGEIQFIGHEVLDNNDDSISCDVQIVQSVFDTATNTTNKVVTSAGVSVTYDTASTPKLTDISPRYGGVEGNGLVKFIGEGFPQVQSSDYKIKIDDRECTVTSVSPTEVQCLTAPRIGAWEQDPKLDFQVTGYGNVATQGLIYRYCSAWSQQSTWGEIFAPVDGESVAVPKGLCLLVDIDNSPRLKLVSVDGGAIVFPPDADPNHHRTFDAHYIMINNGTMEVGTEAHPYTSKLTITMYGTKYDPAMPVYGKKSIGVRFGTLDMHGVEKKSWTDLDATINAGSTQLTLVELVDWEIGDTIMVTSTSYNMWEAELRNITAIDNSNGSKTVLTVDKKFLYKHAAGVETFSTGDSVTIRAEVALMSHNIVYRGDPETSENNQFGAHIMLHSPGDETCIGRIENVQFHDVGQAFLLGKYPIHFHMIGRVTKSYVRNNAVRNSYNRGTTLHGVHYLRVERNTYFNTMGHTIFVEDAAETKNYIAYNVVAGTKPSFSLLGTDQSPGCFWITHPDNIFVGNRAAGSSNYGFWMDYQETSTGPSFDPKIRPIHAKLGEFRNNVAHSVGAYGLRIFHGHTPPQLAYYQDFLSYSNNKNGIMTEDLGKVVFKNVTLVANKQHGFGILRITGAEKDECRIDSAIIVGSSSLVGGSTGLGIIGPHSDLFFVRDARFYNFMDGSGGIGNCLNCQEPKGDSDARTMRFQELYFDDATVTKRIKYQKTFKGILHDLDGTLTGLGPDSYATAYFKHNDQPECTVDLQLFDGIICPGPTAVRRIVFHGPAGNINKMTMHIWKYDNSIVNAMTDEELEQYLVADNATSIAFLEKESPMFHWTVPYVTNHKYYVRWEHGLDFDSVQVSIVPWLWDTSRTEFVLFTLPFYETRAAVNFNTDTGLKANETLIKSMSSDLVMGMNVVYNATAEREMQFIVNAKDGSSSMSITGVLCLENCIDIVDPVVVPEDVIPVITNLWSDPQTWKHLGYRVPEEGEEVVIMPDQNVIYDIGTSPLFKNIQVNGRLTFLQGKPALINTYSLWVRAGVMEIGTPTVPFNSTVEIRLHGNNTSPSEFVFSPSIKPSNKNFIITGTANFYGNPRSGSTRLLQPAYPGQTELLVPGGLDWRAGETLGLAATNIDARNYETVTIQEYNNLTGVVTLEEPMKGYHFGAYASTAEQYSGIDMRGEVMLLNRDIMITASTDASSTTLAHPQPWPCRVLVADFFEPHDFKYRKGTLDWDQVSVYNCSQTNTKYAALGLENAVSGTKVIKNSVFTSGRGLGIQMTRSRKLTMLNSIIHDFVLFGFKADATQDITLRNNILSGVSPSLGRGHPLLKWGEPMGGYELSDVNKMVVTNNTASGTWHSGFSAPGKACDDKNPTNLFEDNIAHSVSGMGVLVSRGAGRCTEMTKFYGYKNELATVHMGGGVGNHNRATECISIDSVYGLAIFARADGTAEVFRNTIYGSQDMKNLDCPMSANGKCGCSHRTGLVVPTFGHNRVIMKNQMDIKKMFSQGGDWSGKSLFKQNKLIGFDSKYNACGGTQAAIASNSYHSDYHPPADFDQNYFINTDESALFKMYDPKPKWANMADCGTFTCTGLYNVLVRVERNSYSGIPSVYNMPKSFDVIPNNKESTSSQVIPGCTYKQYWNGYMCQSETLGVLLFTSLDDDRMDRNSQPIYIQDEERGFDNRLNAFMDHSWDGAYTGQKREQKFPTLLDSSRNYTIEYTGTPPQKQKFTYHAKPGVPGTLITINYPDAGAYKIYDEQKNLVPPTDWDYDIETYAVPVGDRCGENRFIGVKNFLQFWIEPGCTIYVYPRDAIMLAIRLEWNVREFFQEKAVGKFTDRLAAVLGIHKADVKVVQVYQGSVVVAFQIFAGEDDVSPAETLKEIAKKFEETVPELDTFLDRPVMSIITNQGDIQSMPGFQESTEEFQQTQSYDNLISDFLSNRDGKKDEQEPIAVTKGDEVDDPATQEDEIDLVSEPESEPELEAVIEQPFVPEAPLDESTIEPPIHQDSGEQVAEESSDEAVQLAAEEIVAPDVPVQESQLTESEVESLEDNTAEQWESEPSPQQPREPQPSPQDHSTESDHSESSMDGQVHEDHFEPAEESPEGQSSGNAQEIQTITDIVTVYVEVPYEEEEVAQEDTKSYTGVILMAGTGLLIAILIAVAVYLIVKKFRQPKIVLKHSNTAEVSDKTQIDVCYDIDQIAESKQYNPEVKDKNWIEGVLHSKRRERSKVAKESAYDVSEVNEDFNSQNFESQQPRHSEQDYDTLQPCQGRSSAMNKLESSQSKLMVRGLNEAVPFDDHMQTLKISKSEVGYVLPLEGHKLSSKIFEKDNESDSYLSSSKLPSASTPNLETPQTRLDKIEPASGVETPAVQIKDNPLSSADNTKPLNFADSQKKIPQVVPRLDLSEQEQPHSKSVATMRKIQLAEASSEGEEDR